MLSAALRGKVAITEDLVTAATFDAFSDLKAPVLLHEMLGVAVSTTGDRIKLPIFDDYEVALWPQISAGEPDVRLRFLRDGAEIGRCVVEAKLGAGKSGDGALDASGGDQLARYLRYEADDAARSGWSALVYLTHHPSCPIDDLEVSAARLQAAGRPELVSRLFWLSWRDVEEQFRVRRDKFGQVGSVLRRIQLFRYRGALPAPPSLDRRSHFYGTAGDQYHWPPCTAFVRASVRAIHWAYDRARLET